MVITRYVCVHGHFYQPPRENPWLEAIEIEDSAAPYHNWNARIAAECYAANMVARSLDRQGRIMAVSNNYERISFNFGPTLLSWLSDADPQTYEAIIEADRRSVKQRAGHGNALAQAYNHMILPLANARDKATQVRWGIADFEARFGRTPEGMWLPETAVDLTSLETLADQGLRFAVLAPHQAQAVRALDGADADAPWRVVKDGSIDTTRPYLCRTPSGHEIALFFYDGGLSRAVAFEGLLGDGGTFARRIRDAFPAKVQEPQLVHLATDGESYGHHHRYGDMALAYTLAALEGNAEIRLTNYGEFLEIRPPTEEVRIHEQTSWSCAHGVQRWSDDCGCQIAGGSQAWRRPLRDALDWLRDEVDALFEAKASGLLRDPWEARDQYIDVILNRSVETLDRFLQTRAQQRLGHFDRVDALSLLEMQRHRMLMFTSCGWFFDDCSGLESVQILKYAARTIQLASSFGASRLEQRFIDRLRAMTSNHPDAGDGAHIYRTMVRPSIVDLRRVVSHHAITSLSDDEQPRERQLYCYCLRDLDWTTESYGGTKLALGRVRVQSQVTQAIEDVSFGLLHFGGHDFNCSLRGAVNVEGYDAMRDHLLRIYQEKSLTDVVHAFDRYFEGRHFGLTDLFVEGRRAVLATVTRGVLADMEETYEGFYERHRKLFDFLKKANFPLPNAFTRTVEFALERRIADEFQRLEQRAKEPTEVLTHLEELAREVQRRGIRVAPEVLAPALSQGIEALAEQLVPRWSSGAVMAVRRALALSTRLQLEPRLWDVQNTVLSALEQRPPSYKSPRRELETLLEELGLAPELLQTNGKSPVASA